MGMSFFIFCLTYTTLSCLELCQGDELCNVAAKTRKVLYTEVKRRFIDAEREGHMEDLLVSTILDPRFKLMNFEGMWLVGYRETLY